MLCIAYAHSGYDYARLMWITVEKQFKLPRKQMYLLGLSCLALLSDKSIVHS